MPDTPTTDKLLVSARELAALFGVDKCTIWTWHSGGKIPMPVKIGGTTRWQIAEVKAWLAAGAPGRTRWEMSKGSPR